MDIPSSIDPPSPCYNPQFPTVLTKSMSEERHLLTEVSRRAFESPTPLDVLNSSPESSETTKIYKLEPNELEPTLNRLQ